MIDLFSRQVIGWSLRFDMAGSIVIDALRMAQFRRLPSKQAGLIFHSDRVQHHRLDEPSRRLPGTTELGCTRRRPTSARCSSRKTGWPINPGRPEHEPSYGIRNPGRGVAGGAAAVQGEQTGAGQCARHLCRPSLALAPAGPRLVQTLPIQMPKNRGACASIPSTKRPPTRARPFDPNKQCQGRYHLRAVKQARRHQVAMRPVRRDAPPRSVPCAGHRREGSRWVIAALAVSIAMSTAHQARVAASGHAACG